MNLVGEDILVDTKKVGVEFFGDHDLLYCKVEVLKLEILLRGVSCLESGHICEVEQGIITELLLSGNFCAAAGHPTTHELGSTRHFMDAEN